MSKLPSGFIQSPLHFVTTLKEAQGLIAAGVDCCALDKYGRTPLMALINDSRMLEDKDKLIAFLAVQDYTNLPSEIAAEQDALVNAWLAEKPGNIRALHRARKEKEETSKDSAASKPNRLSEEISKHAERNLTKEDKKEKSVEEKAPAKLSELMGRGK